MFCPNCGNEIPQNSNYCPVCGKKLKNVKISITPINPDDNSNKNEDTKETLDEKDVTRIFKPVGGIDGIDNTNEIKDIIKAVDEKVSENIHKYETSSFSKKDLNLDKKTVKSLDKKTDSKKSVDKKSKQENKEINKINKQSKKEILEKDKKLNKNNNSTEKSDSKKVLEKPQNKKKNLKELWHNFINESDDEYSIFSSFSEEKDKNTKEDKIEISNANTSSTSDTYMENTMGIPKIEIEKALKNAGFKGETKKDESITKKEVKKDSKKDESIINPLPENNKQKEIKKEKITIEKQKKDLNQDIQNLDNSTKKDLKQESPKEKFSHKSFTDQVNEELKKLEEQQAVKDNSNLIDDSKKDSIFKKANIFKKDKSSKKDTIKEDLSIKDKEDDSKRDSIFKKTKSKKEDIIKQNISTKKEDIKKDIISKKEDILNKVSDNNTDIENSKEVKFYNFMDFISNKIDKLNSKVVFDGKRSFIIALIIGIVFSFIPILMGYKKISFTLVLLLVFKLLFNILEFYIPLNITTEKVWVETSEDEVKYFAFINWFICQIFLFISYVLSPWDGGFLSFNLLSALTPLPIATIILFLMAITISLTQYWNQLKYENKINFIGWYAISFILIHFVSKLFFVLTNFLY